MSFTDAEVDEFVSEILAETQWKAEKLSIQDFMETFTSAQPVRLVPQGREIKLEPGDLLHPFLAFSRRRRTKVYAENLVWDDSAEKFTVKGPPLEIPKDYVGWFEIVKDPYQIDQSCQSTIEKIIATKCKYFLTRTTIIGHTASDNNNDEVNNFQLGEELRVYPGEVLEVGEIMTKKWKMQAVGDNIHGNGGHKKKKDQCAETKFLQCIDRRGRTVYLPFAHPGQFYAMWNSQMKASKYPRNDVIYYVYDMLNFGFPLLARVVFGWPPTDFPEFSGFLRFLGINRPDTLILRSLRPGSCAIVELPLDCDVKIEVMSNLEFLSNNKIFEKILGHSCDRIYPYLIGMKHMDTRYPVLASLDTEDKDSKDTAHKPRDACRMARPRDMGHFNPLDIFPPLQEPIRKVAESWTLSFKDPDFNKNGAGELREADSVIVDPEDGKIRGDGYQKLGANRQNSVIGGMQTALKGLKIGESGVSRRDQIWHKQADMEQVLLEREAEC